MIYTPDNWVMVKIDNDGEVLHKILGGWSGGYLDGDRWRINSGIEKVVDDELSYDFIGYSGSVYKCYKDRERLSLGTHSIFKSMEDSDLATVTLVDAISYS